MKNKKINLLINGYGRMGRLVNKYAKREENVGKIIKFDPRSKKADYKSLSNLDLKEFDALIDFSNGQDIIEMVEIIEEKNANIRIVVGTSAWDEERDGLVNFIKKKGMYFMYGANFSLGTNIFMKLIKDACSLMNKFENFDPTILDIHHRHKVDMPSGTAKKVASDIVEKLDRKEKILYGMRDGGIRKNELHVNSLRQGENKGFHEVIFDSEEEVIRISNQTLDRGAFAQGALIGMKWLMKRREPGYYTFEDCMESMFE